VRTEGDVDAIVLESSATTRVASRAPSWRATRTVRALGRLGIRGVKVCAEDDVGQTLAAAEGPTWLLRAGAVPIAAPRLPPRSATGRWLLALGATHDDGQWTTCLAATGGNLSEVNDGLPPVRSVFVERPTAFAEALEQSVSKLTRSSTTDSISLACSRIAGVARVVRVPAFDVAFTEVPHVVELVTTLHRGGAERVVLDLARELDVLGFDVTLAVLDRASRTTFDAPAGTVFLDDHAGGRSERLEALGAMAIAIGADLVHAHLVNGDDLRLLTRSGVPLVTTIHNSQRGWPIKLDAVSPGEIALAIACSRDVERQLEEVRFPAPVRTIWNGIARGSAKTSTSTSTSTSTISILVVANHRPQKRLERIPTIVAELRSRGHDARVLIVGEPVKADVEMASIEGRIRKEAERLGVADAVELAGSRSDVDALYASHDIVVSTSAFEGLSLVHLESLAAGLPLVTTSVAGIDELKRKHSHVVAVPLDARPTAFGDAIVAALEDGPTGVRPTLAPDFTASKMAERHADLFARVLTTPRAPARRKGGLVLLANNFSTGGAQSSARRLLLTLASAGVPVRAVVLQEQAAFPTPGRAALLKAGIDVLVAPRAGDVDPLVTARAIALAIDEWEPEALLFWNVISQHKVLLADLLLDTPIWDVSPGEMYFASFERYLAKPRVGSPYLTMRDYGRRLAGVIVKYEAERAQAEEALGVAVHVVPNGVEIPTLLPERSRGLALRGDGVPPDPLTVIGTLARLGVDKKLEQLIDAVAHAVARGQFDACELRIAGAAETGDEAYVAALRERARDLPITWAGEQDARTFLAELDLFAMVSEPGGCPNASLEAMAAGLAVVATDAGGAAEQIVHGETGLLVPRGDSVALGEAIAELAHDPVRRAAMGRAGHARALARFDVQRMARDYSRLCLGAVPAALELPSTGAHAPAPLSPRSLLHEPGARVQVTTRSV
jgi:glycosyltransferase involved in cell wall biosynthesis